MIRKATFLFILSVCFLTCISCSTRVGGTIHLSKIPTVEIDHGSKITASDAALFIDELRDTRPESQVADFNGRSIFSDSAFDLLVKESLQQTFRQKGFVISDSAAVVLSGEIRQWHAEITGGVPGTVKSKASIFLEVFDPANRRVYTGTYQGTASVERASINDKDVNVSLTTAMQQAIRQVVLDEQLVKLLSSF